MANCSGPPSPPLSTPRSAAATSACSASATWSRRLSGTTEVVAVHASHCYTTPPMEQYPVTSPGVGSLAGRPANIGEPSYPLCTRTSVPTVSPTVEALSPRGTTLPSDDIWSPGPPRRGRAQAPGPHAPPRHGPNGRPARPSPSPRDSRGAYPQAPHPRPPMGQVPDPSEAETALIEIFGPREAFGPPPEEMPAHEHDAEPQPMMQRFRRVRSHARARRVPRWVVFLLVIGLASVGAGLRFVPGSPFYPAPGPRGRSHAVPLCAR